MFAVSSPVTSIRIWIARILGLIILPTQVVMAVVGVQAMRSADATPFDADVVRNVRDFGAKGDGVTDDTDAIQAGMASAGFATGPGQWYKHLGIWVS